MPKKSKYKIGDTIEYSWDFEGYTEKDVGIIVGVEYKAVAENYLYILKDGYSVWMYRIIKKIK